MAASRKLKVYRTAIGFHDAYVAAPSQKAALAAWGSDHDLFARGTAEIVEDPALAAAPLAAPGTVIKRLRGTPAEQIAALPQDRPKRARAAPDAPPPPARKPRPAPRPDRVAIEAAEQALADAVRRHDAEDDALAAEEADLARRRRAQDKAHRDERERLGRARDDAETDYRKALARWRG